MYDNDQCIFYSDYSSKRTDHLQKPFLFRNDHDYIPMTNPI